MRNILVLFTTAIFLLAGMSNLEAQNHKGKKGECAGCCQSEKTATEKAKAVSIKLTETLKLDKDQSEKVEAIYLNLFTEQENKVKEGKKGKKGKKSKKVGNKYQMKYEAIEAELAKVLTEEQMVEYKKIMEEKKTKRAKKSKNLRGKKNQE